MNELEARLATLAAQQQTTTYGALVRDLAIPGPGAIAKLTAALELLMEHDAAHGLPLRAVLCAGRLAQGMPAQGFFDKARALGRFESVDAQGFVTTERQRLFALFAAS
ncbi:hypothetical protein GCM10010873_28180 [Cypionkella aquatica]|uniref:Uncharacterized protein n=1 Tax=Cypionkella aquatica TaxID=1756042 RepID=A0AA37X2A9_9RHOB|nr:hypothetical protein [Cypionkella aquatica]GLS87844.1 hypothetical protein GCM10010873_28180 [Cypionkella aquatica]